MIQDQFVWSTARWQERGDIESHGARVEESVTVLELPGP